MRHPSLLVLAACCLPAIPEERPGAMLEEPPAPEGGGEPKPPAPECEPFVPQDPTIGRVVHYRVGGTDETPELRPAFVVRTWGGSSANLQVLVDGMNDSQCRWPGTVSALFNLEELNRGIAWKTSVGRGAGVGQWRWPARA